MQNSLSQGGLFINDFHRSNSMAAQREVAIMSLHPYSREQVLTQVASLRRKAVSKESANAQRRWHQQRKKSPSLPDIKQEDIIND